MLKSIGLMSCGHLVTMIICARVLPEAGSRNRPAGACLHVAVLEGVVQQDDVGAGIVQLQQLADAMAAVDIDRYTCLREFFFHLIGLVAYPGGIAMGVCQYITFAFALVAAAQYGDVQSCLLQQSYQILRVRRLARTAYGQVSDADDRDVKALRLENLPVEELVTEPYSPSIDP